MSNETKHQIEVVAHSGYRGEERPMAVILDRDRFDVKEIEDSWISSGIEPWSDVKRGFVVRCRGGARFRLIHCERTGWSGELLPGPRIVPENTR